MTRTYTAADFANARFAEHPAGGRGHRIGPNEWRLGDSTFRFSTEEMIGDGWVPVTPAATITDSDVENLCDPHLYNNDAYLDGFIQGFQAAGGTILDDPEPTEAQKIEQLLWQISSEYSSVTLHGAEAVKGWAHQLAKHGVRVEEGK